MIEEGIDGIGETDALPRGADEALRRAEEAELAARRGHQENPDTELVSPLADADERRTRRRARILPARPHSSRASDVGSGRLASAMS